MHHFLMTSLIAITAASAASLYPVWQTGSSVPRTAGIYGEIDLPVRFCSTAAYYLLDRLTCVFFRLPVTRLAVVQRLAAP
jgi:hypothetical protein